MESNDYGLFFWLKKTVYLQRWKSPTASKPSLKPDGEAIHLSHEKTPGCLGYVGDHATQVHRDLEKNMMNLHNQQGFHGK